ncbi:MAG: enoyl-CoA hydratase/isomerase family protein [Anaerolineae bacterium]
MAFETMIYERENGIATITLNRPERLNAINATWLEEFEQVLEKASSDDEVRAVIITGAGRAFCSGADLKEWAGFEALGSRLTRKSPAHGGMRVFVLQLQNVDKPTIAAVNGPAFGGGFALALACDIRIASDRASFSQIFVERGLVPDSGSTYFLPRAAGLARACEMVFTAEILDAEQAKESGLVNRVVPHDELMPIVKEFAAKIAAKSPIAVRLAKQALYKGATTDLVTAIEYEGHMQHICFRTEDFAEGMAAFLEKREPHFKGK